MTDNLLCGYCTGKLQLADAVYCAKDDTPHHEECFPLKGCTSFGCGGTEYYDGIDKKRVYSAKAKITALAKRDEQLPITTTTLDDYFVECDRVVKKNGYLGDELLQELLSFRLPMDSKAHAICWEAYKEIRSVTQTHHAKHDYLTTMEYNSAGLWGVEGFIVGIVAGGIYSALWKNFIPPEYEVLGIAGGLVVWIGPAFAGFYIGRCIDNYRKKRDNYPQQLQQLETDKTEKIKKLKADYRQRLEELATTPLVLPETDAPLLESTQTGDAK